MYQQILPFDQMLGFWSNILSTTLPYLDAVQTPTDTVLDSKYKPLIPYTEWYLILNLLIKELVVLLVALTH